MASTRSGEIKTIVKKLPTVANETVEWAIKAVRKPALAAVARDTGGDRKLSGLRNGKSMTVVVTRKTTGTIVEADIKGGPQRQRAPWFWLEEGTKAGRRSRPANRRRSGRVITAQHPGTPAKRTWSGAVDPIVPKIQARFRQNIRKATQG